LFDVIVDLVLSFFTAARLSFVPGSSTTSRRRQKNGSRDRRVQRLVPAVILRKCLLDVILGRASQLALLRKDIGSIKKQLVAANLTPTNTEATKFWPL
jgi:hypothetical protein